MTRGIRRTVVVLAAAFILGAPACRGSTSPPPSGPQDTFAGWWIPQQALPERYLKASAGAVDGMGKDPVCAVQPKPTAPPPPTAAWTTYAMGDFEWSGSPQVLGSSLFLAGPVLLELDRTTGAGLWLRDSETATATDATEKVGQDGRLYVFHPDLLAYDRTTHLMTHGRVATLTVDFAGAPAALPDGRVVVQDAKGTVWMLRPQPKASGYDVVWKHQAGLGVGGVTPANGDPQALYRVLYDGTRGWIYANATGATPGASLTVALDADTGKELWRTPGCGLGLTPFGPDEIVRWTYAGAGGEVQVLDDATGEVRDSYGPADLVAANASADRVYVTSPAHAADGSRLPQSVLTALNARLEPLWSWTTPPAASVGIAGGRTTRDGTIPAAPAIGSDGSVYVTTRSCALFALDPSGHLEWADAQPYRFGAVRPLFSNGMLYTVSQLPRVVMTHVPRSDTEYFREFGLSMIRAYPVGPWSNGP